MAADKQRIGFIGVGLMGHGMAKNLLAKGYAVTVVGHRNRAPVESLLAKGASEAQSPSEAAKTADIVLMCVTGSPQVEETVYKSGGLLEAARGGLIVVDCSTSEPDSTARIAADFAKRGATYVDAPLTRTPKEAEEGRLNVLVGADAATFEKLRPVLSAFAENVFHVGGSGAGHKTKLFNNFLALGFASLLAEALVGAAKAGVNLDALYKLVSAGPISNGLFQMIVPNALKGDFAQMKFAIVNAAKDLRYYTHMIESAGSTAFLAECIHQNLVQAVALGFGEKFVPSLIEAQAKVNGVKIGG